MEALIHNLNSMHSRAGSQIPFTSLNFGTDTSEAGRLVTQCFLKALYKGLGSGETPVFPISVFKVKAGVNFNKNDPNYDLYELAIKTSAKRLFPNFVFIDAPFNLQYYSPKDPNSEVATMGCRTRVIGSVFEESNGKVSGRGNLSFTTINLPRISLECKSEKSEENFIKKFIEILNQRMELVTTQLLHRFSNQCSKTVKNFPFMIGQKIWKNYTNSSKSSNNVNQSKSSNNINQQSLSETLTNNSPLKHLLKHGTLSIGFIGLAEAMCVLYPSDPYYSEKVQKTALSIVRNMREFCDKMSSIHHLNFTLLATPAESLCGRFVALDKIKFGVLPNITDREYYTNSFHVPVYEKVNILTKIKTEAPYHALCNAGAITYVEVDGDMSKNPKAFETIIRLMHQFDIGYGAINHPIDRCVECLFESIIDKNCPMCNSDNIERIRRITGYLVGTMDVWNLAKKAEEKDRIKHINN
jgi:ribonucleoside-triphosphate reductase